MSHENSKTIEPLEGDLRDAQMQLCYMEGIIVGKEFVSAGKSFWITNDPEGEDAGHVYRGNLYKVQEV